MVVITDGPANIAEHTDEHAEDCEDEPELGLVHAAVVLSHPDDAPVVEGAGKNHREGDPNEARQVCEALVVNSVSGEEVSWGHGWEAVRGGEHTFWAVSKPYSRVKIAEVHSETTSAFGV